MISSEKATLDITIELSFYGYCKFVAHLYPATNYIASRSLSPLASKTSRSKTVAENFIRPQLNDLIFYTSTFHPSSINTSWALLILPTFNPSQPCRFHQQVPISSVRMKLFPNIKLWGSRQSSGSALSVSFPSNATHYHVCFSQVLIAKVANEFYPDSAKILKLNMNAQVVLSALPVYIVKGVIHRAGWEFPC